MMTTDLTARFRRAHQIVKPVLILNNSLDKNPEIEAIRSIIELVKLAA